MDVSSIAQGKFHKVFAKYVSLSVVSMLGLSLYILADTFFVAAGIGSSGLAALNLALPAYSFINGIALMFGMGAATRFSILMGEKNTKQASRVFTQTMWIAGAVGFAITLVGAFFAYDIARLLGADHSILPLTGKYLQTIMLFSCAFILNNVLVCFVRNDKSPKLAMIAMMTGCISNIVLDYVFIFPLKMGMFGAAFATGLAPILGMCVLSLHFLKKNNSFTFVAFKIDKAEIAKVFSLGAPSFITEFSSGLIMLVFNFTILRVAGNMGVAAYGIIANLALIVTAIFTGIAQGIQPILSFSHGAGQAQSVRRTFFSACVLALGLGSIFYLAGTHFSEQIISIFNHEGNHTLAQIAALGIEVYFIAFFVMGINIVATSFFSSVSQPKHALFISLTRGFIAILPIILILSKLFQISGVWMTIPAVEAITLVVSMACLASYTKEARQLNLST